MRKRQILMIVVAAGALFWIGDAVLDALFFKRTDLARELFSPGGREIWERLFAASLLAALAFVVQRENVRQRHAAELIRDEKTRSESILDAIGDGVSIQDLEFRVLYQNKAHRDLVGGHPGEFCYHAYEGNRSPCPGCPVLKTFTDGRIHREERTNVIAGAVRQFEITASPLRDSSGATTACIEIVREITSRKQAEAAMQESAEKFRTLFDESKDVFYVSTVEGKFLDINPAGVELFGYPSKEELLKADIGRDLYVDLKDRTQFVDVVGRTSYAKDYEVEMRRRNGEKLRVIITSTALHDAHGKVRAFRGVIRDVTGQRKLEQQLLQSQKMEAIGLLAGGIAHDFNNIMTVIVGYGNMLLKQVRNNDKQRACVEQVLEASERATRLTRSILAFSRKQVLHPEPVDVNAVIGRVERFLSRLIGEDIALKAVLHGADMTVQADSGQLEQVLINLATNARDAMPNGGSLLIETSIEKLDTERALAHGIRTPGDYAVISVTDTGAGFDEKTRERVFEPFFTTKEAGKGTGLGLAIAYGIVTQHGGNILVESEPGAGTRFQILLPMVKEQPADQTPGPADARGGTETILVAEDEPAVLQMTSQVLEGAGYHVVQAASGSEAVARFSENPDGIHLLVLDVVMPNKNGKEAYDEIRKTRRDARALFMSGYTGDIMHTKGILDTGFDFVAKPVAPSEFLRKVREILDR